MGTHAGLVRSRVTPLAGLTGGIVEAVGLGDGFPHRSKTIAKLRLTMPPIVSCMSAAMIGAKLNQAGTRPDRQT